MTAKLLIVDDDEIIRDIQEEFRAIARRFVDSNADMDKKKEYLTQAVAVSP